VPLQQGAGLGGGGGGGGDCGGQGRATLVASIKIRVETAWFQLLKAKHHTLHPDFAFSFIFRR
jgi:hypothetical protein